MDLQSAILQKKLLTNPSLKSSTACSSKALHSHKRSNFSISSDVHTGNIDSINFINENLKLEHQIEKLRSDKKLLKAKIKQIDIKLSKEIKERDEVIVSLTNLIKEREENFQVLFNEQVAERDRMIGKKEYELQRTKKTLKLAKDQIKEIKCNENITQQGIEIENLRKLLVFAEKENKELEGKIKIINETADTIEKIIENDN